MGEHSTYGGPIIENAVGSCPEVKVKLGGVDVGCLIDTGAEVSTMTESFYQEFLAQGREVIDVTSYIKISASQGLEIPVDESHVCVRRAGSDDEVKCNSKTDAILSRMDVGDLTESQQERLQQVIGRYQSTFSEDEDDLGFCDLVKHKIVTKDDKPIRVPHRRVPPARSTGLHSKVT